MAEGQKSKQIGKGMKPRGNKRFKKQKEVKVVTDQSTIEGQQTSSSDMVLGVPCVNETPGNLEPENGEKSLQNLEKYESIVAHEDVLEEISEAGNELLAALSDSEEFVKCERCGEEYIEDQGHTTEDDVTLCPKCWHLCFDDPDCHVGTQPDGSEKFIITVQEGYTDAVRQWAEADGVPVQQWLSDRLYEYISTYGEPAKPR